MRSTRGCLRTTRRLFLATALVYTLLCGASNPTRAASNEAVTGIWEVEDGGYTLVLELLPDGSGFFDEVPIRYDLEGDRLTVLEDDGEQIRYRFAASENVLTLSEGDLDGSMRFQRRGKAPKAANAADSANAADAAATSNAAIDRTASPNDAAPSPVGTWQFTSAQGSLQLLLRADGTGALNGSAGKWQWANGSLTLIGADGASVTYAASLALNALTLSGGDLPMPITFNRQAASSTDSQGQAGATSGSGAASGSGALPELVGTWCYMSTFRANNGGGSSTQDCYTFNADGTYSQGGESSVDAYAGGAYGGTASQSGGGGSWNATATTLTLDGQTMAYERRNNENGDPMICVDGRCYVTYYQKAPW